MSDEHSQVQLIAHIRTIAIRLPPDQREAFLATACGGDQGLLQSVLRQLNTDDETTHAEDSGADPLIGRRIGNYRILQALGSGGMGQVYKGLDTRLERHVALKFLHPHLLADPASKERFIQEAKAASGLDHPNICTIHDIGETDEGRLYIVMAFYSADNLAELIHQGPLPVTRALDIAIQILHGLAATHARQIIHRDIKPGNVLLTHDGRVKLVDFGIAKMADNQLTQPGTMLGTTAYMAPEQFQDANVDQRTDLWSVGVLLYQMLTGRRPFEGRSRGSLMNAILNQEPAAPGSLRPDLPRALDQTILQVLQKSPVLRPSSAAEWAGTLERIHHGLAPTAQAGRSTPPNANATVVATESSTRTPPTAGHSGEIRQVVLLYAKFDRFGELADNLDLEDLHRLLERFHERAELAAGDCGGRIEQRFGDGVLILFGLPRAHDNDSLRAVHCARQLHGACRTLAGEWQRPLALRIGLRDNRILSGALPNDTGDTARRAARHLLTGDYLDRLNRLLSRAPAGTTVIDNTLHQSVTRYHPLTELTPDTSHAERCWLLLDPRHAGRAADPPEQHPGLVGRRQELRQFRGVLEDCLEERCGRIIQVRGEAGIGKTRLVEEYLSQARVRGYACHTGLVLDFGATENAIAGVVRSLLNGRPDDDAAGIEQAVTAGWLDDNERMYLYDLLRLPLPEELRTVFDALDHKVREQQRSTVIGHLVRRIAERQPLLIRIEDLHWSDAATLDLLAELVLACRARPVLFVFTSRIEGDPLDKAWRSRVRGVPLLSLDLAPLNDSQAGQLARRFKSLAPELIAECIARADGNPLFLEQLLHNARDSGAVGVPGSIQNLVLARLDQLAEPDRWALRAASAIGQRFGLATVRHLLDDPTHDCQPLLDQYLIRPQGEDYLFVHALIREGVYASMLKADRRALHRKLADWYTDTNPALHAEHLERAGDPAAAAYLTAARAESRRYRYDDALRLAERGLALDDPTQRPALLRLQGEALYHLGRIAESLDIYRTATAAANDPTERCRALLGQVPCLNLTDSYQQVLETLQQAQQLAESVPLTAELAQIHYLRGNLFFPLGRIDNCRTEHGLALRHATVAGSAEDEAKALSGLGDAEYAAGRMLSAHGYFERCMTLCRQHGFGRIEAANRFMVGTMRIYLNQSEGALEDSLASAELAARVGHQRAEIISRLTASWILIDGLALDRAEEQVERAQGLARDLGAGRFEAFLGESLARIHYYRGDRETARGVAERALAMMRESGGQRFIGPWVLATVALTAADEARYREALTEGARILAEGAIGHNHFRFHQLAMETALTRDDWDTAERHARALADYTAAEPTPWSDLHCRRTRVLVARGRGEPYRSEELQTLLQEAEAAGLRTAVDLLRRAVDHATGMVEAH